MGEHLGVFATLARVRAKRLEVVPKHLFYRDLTGFLS